MSDPTSYAGGASGPRRKTADLPDPPTGNNNNSALHLASIEILDPFDTAAANAEAARLAREMGIASDPNSLSSSFYNSSSSQSIRNRIMNPGRWILRRQSSSSVANSQTHNAATRPVIEAARRNADSNGVEAHLLPLSDQQANGSIPVFPPSQGPGPPPPLSAALYHRMTDDPTPFRVGIIPAGPALARSLSPNTGSHSSSTTMVASDDGIVVRSSHSAQEPQQQLDTTKPTSPTFHIFDAHGQPLPYKEGPYFVTRQHDGRVVKRRWYGRLEDGYLAWSSLYLHEYFGFTIYTPLTPEEQEEMKKPDGSIPRWMYEFTSLPNLAIPMSYFCIGVALQLLRTPLIVYFIEDLGATPAEVNVLFTVMAVPWCFKVIYGFLSDCVPISGLRRKPYFMTGWLVYILSNLILMITPVPSIQLCILLVFTQTAGYMLADVMTDALIVERSRYETQETRGTMQSTGYIIRFFGSTVGASIGAVVYNKDGDWSFYLPIRLVFFINAAFPLVFLLPFVPYLLELDTSCQPKDFYRQCKDLFETAQLRSVWQPMTFVYVYNALQLTNAAWMNYLVEGLAFSAWQIGLVSIVGSVMAWFGIMAYKKFFFASNWRIVYFWCTTLASIIALGQLILVFGINRQLGIPDIWFSMGDDVLVEFVIAVQFLPMCIMYLGLCPPGSEGTTYAMLTTWSNLAGSLAFDISTALTMVWNVSSETIAAGDYSGVWKLSLLCGVIGPVPLVLLSLIPKNKEDQRRLQQDKTRHYWAGVTFISVMVFTLLITFVESIYEVTRHDEYVEVDENDEGRGRRRLMRLMLGR